MVDEPQDINDPKNNDEDEVKPKAKVKAKDKDGKRKLQSFKGFDANKYVDVEPSLDEAAGSSSPAIVTFGRMNPITVGHEKLASAVISQAQKNGGTPYIYLSQSQDKNKNPLSYNDKIKYAQKAFGKAVIKSKARTIIEVMVELSGKHKDVIVVVGSDRVKEFDKLLNKYNKSSAGYVFNNISVVSAGQRDPDAEGVKGMSGTKMRGFAADNDVKKFATGLPTKLKTSAAAILADVRKGMNMSEDNDNEFENMEDFVENTEELDEVLDRMQRRAIGIRMRKNRFKMKRGREKAARRTATMEVLKKRARKQAIKDLKNRFAKTKRYADMSSGEKIVIDKRVSKFSKQRLDAMARKLLPKMKVKERDRKRAKAKNEDLNTQFENFMIEKTGPYYTGVAKNKKDDREDHFERNAKKADNDASAYKPAPGDKEAKTKESKHTKKARAMGYTEDLDESHIWGQRQGKRPHMLLDKNGKTKFDKRFKMYKPKLQEDTDLIGEDIVDLMKSTESYIQEDAADKSLAKKAEKSGMPKGVLKQVYNRGVAAWKTGHRPGTTPEQWGHARVNSFITKSSGTWGKADKDLAAKVRKEEVELDEAPRRKGAPKMTGDSIAIQRAKDAEHNKAMGRTKTGRKKPVRQMTSTQRSLAQLRGEEVDLGETYKITKMYNPTTKKSRAAGKSTATFAVHSHDRKHFKEFPNQKDAEKHLKSLGKKEEADLDEMDFSIKSVKKSGLASLKKANNYDKLKSDIAKMRDKLNKDKGLKTEAEINELDKDTLANYANKAIKDKENAKYDKDRAQNSRAANIVRGNSDGIKKDVKDINKADARIKRRERGAANFTRKILKGDKENKE